jgi:hypothetical protein
MSKTSDIVKELPGVVVHKSVKDAFRAISGELEKKHIAVLKANKNGQKRRK